MKESIDVPTSPKLPKLPTLTGSGPGTLLADKAVDGAKKYRIGEDIHWSLERSLIKWSDGLGKVAENVGCGQYRTGYCREP